jgi:hypothetical protein
MGFVEQGEGALVVVTCFDEPPHMDQREAHSPMGDGLWLRASERLREAKEFLGQLQLLSPAAEQMENPVPEQHWEKALRVA